VCLCAGDGVNKHIVGEVMEAKVKRRFQSIATVCVCVCMCVCVCVCVGRCKHPSSLCLSLANSVTPLVSQWRVTPRTHSLSHTHTHTHTELIEAPD